MTSPQTPPASTPAADAGSLERVMFEIKRVIVGQERLVERLMVGAAGARPLPARGRARRRQDARRRDPGSHGHGQLLADAVHAGPGPVRHRRHADLPAEHGTLRYRTRPGDGQLRAGRRDQPRPGQGAVGDARGDGRGPREHRRPALRRAAAVPGARDAEPDRVRGRLPAPRGPARPVPHEDRRRLPDRGRGARDRLPDGRRAADRKSGDQHRGPDQVAGDRRDGCSSTTRSSTTWSELSSLRGTRPSTAWPTSPPGSPTAPAHGPASA